MTRTEKAELERGLRELADWIAMAPDGMMEMHDAPKVRIVLFAKDIFEFPKYYEFLTSPNSDMFQDGGYMAWRRDFSPSVGVDFSFSPPVCWQELRAKDENGEAEG